MVKLSTCASPSVACLGSRCNGLSTSSVRRTLCLPVPSVSPAPRRRYPDLHYALIPFSGSPGQTRSPHQQGGCNPRLKSLSCNAFVTCSGLRSGWSGSSRSSRGSVQIFIPQGKQSTSASSWRSADEEPPRDSSSSQLL
jgi:hypothetical protein